MKDKRVFIIAFIGLCVGFAGGYFLANNKTQSVSVKYDALLLKVNQIYPPTKELFTLSGNVKAIKGNTLIVDVSTSLNPFEDFPGLREIAVSTSTEIVIIKQKAGDVYAKELAKYKENNSKGVPPARAIESPIMYKDIEIGQLLAIIADRDIKSDPVIKNPTKIRVVPMQ